MKVTSAWSPSSSTSTSLSVTCRSVGALEVAHEARALVLAQLDVGRGDGGDVLRLERRAVRLQHRADRLLGARRPGPPPRRCAATRATRSCACAPRRLRRGSSGRLPEGVGEPAVAVERLLRAVGEELGALRVGEGHAERGQQLGGELVLQLDQVVGLAARALRGIEDARWRCRPRAPRAPRPGRPSRASPTIIFWMPSVSATSISLSPRRSRRKSIFSREKTRSRGTLLSSVFRPSRVLSCIQRRHVALRGHPGDADGDRLLRRWRGGGDPGRRRRGDGRGDRRRAPQDRRPCAPPVPRRAPRGPPPGRCATPASDDPADRARGAWPAPRDRRRRRGSRTRASCRWMFLSAFGPRSRNGRLMRLRTARCTSSDTAMRPGARDRLEARPPRSRCRRGSPSRSARRRPGGCRCGCAPDRPPGPGAPASSVWMAIAACTASTALSKSATKQSPTSTSSVPPWRGTTAREDVADARRAPRRRATRPRP